MGKQRRLFPSDGPEPAGCSALESISLVFLLNPPYQASIQTTEYAVKCRFVVPPVVVDPPSDYPVVQPGQILQALVAPPVYPPASDFRRDGFGCLATNAWKEINEEHPLAVNRRPGSKSITQKIEAGARVVLSPIAILTVDDLCLRRMHFELARFQSLFDLTPDELRLRYRPAVNDQSSSPGESHPQALPEPDVNVSAHPAPIARSPV